ncbi:MAG: N-acetylmuramoyl-L-alanine amidase [Deltaproteobacteria bacterium]|nr:N-acetylmuramoyl-L-alanine amidase [Deltaproteobacteria bacterium]
MLRLLMLAMLSLVTLGSLGGEAAAQQKIVIDAGHGGTDPGGTGTGMQEKVIVLDVSKRFEALLKADTADTGGGGAWTALLTRSNDTFVSLAGRSAYSNNQGADRFMSIHANAFGDASANGIETFSIATTGTGAALRNLVQAEMVAAWGLTNRGNKVANFAVLRDTAAPAVLHELAFVTNPTDAAKLGSATERQKAAVAHLRALQRHYNLAPYVPGTPPPPPVDQDGSIAGRVVDDRGPVEGAMVKLDDGTIVATDAEGAFDFPGAKAGAHRLAATAAGHDDSTVDVTVAAGVQADVEITLVRHRDGPDPTEPDGEADGGCSAGSGAGGAGLAGGLLLALALSGRRRRGGRA